MRRAACALAACALAVCALATGSVRAAETPIRIGATGPIATEAGAPLRGLAAYVRYADAHGGVGGRPVELTLLDDGGDPGRAAANATRLDSAGALALVGVGDAASSDAIRAASPLPQLLPSSGAVPGAFAPPESAQGAVFARRILAAGPGARVAVVSADTAEGRALAAGLRRGFGAVARRALVASLRLDPATPVAAQVAGLRSSGADTLCLLGLGAATPTVLAATRGWRHVTYVDAASAWGGPLGPAEGIVTEVWSRGAVAPAPGDPAEALIRAIAGPARARDPAFVDGLALGYALVDALRHAPKPTRAALVRAAARLAEPSNPFLLPGVTVRPGGTPARLLLVQRRRAGWVALGGLQAAG